MAELQKNKKVDNDFALELDDISDGKASDWDKPAEKQKSESTAKKSDMDNYDDDNWDMSDQDLQLQDHEPKGRAVQATKVAETKNVVFNEIPAAKQKIAEPRREEPKQNIDFFGTNLDDVDHSKIENKRDSNDEHFGDGNFFDNHLANDFGDIEHNAQ